MADLFSGLASMWQKPALVSEVLQEAPAGQPRETLGLVPRPMDAADYALEAQRSLLNAGFSERRALAGALTTLAFERPLVANKSGKERRLSQKASRHLRYLAATISEGE